MKDLAFLENLNAQLVKELDASLALEKELRGRIERLEAALLPFANKSCAGDYDLPPTEYLEIQITFKDIVAAHRIYHESSN